MDNYTKFPNDLLEAIIGYKLTAAQVKVMLYVIRKVNGWGKPSDAISITRIAKKTGYSRRTIITTVSDLEKMGVLEVERHGAGRMSEMRVSAPKNWDQPVNCTSHVKSTSLCSVLHRGVKPASQVDVKCTSQEGVKPASHTKDTLKDTLKDTYENIRPSAPLFSGKVEELEPGDEYLEGWEDA